MKQLKALILAPMMILLAHGCANPEPNSYLGESWSKNGYQYLSAASLKSMLDKKQPLTIVDIQVEAEFAAHSIPGAIATYAYPVKTDAQKAKIDAVMSQLDGKQPIVVVCPRGGGGARRCFHHLVQRGIPASRLFILENGQSKWPYAEYTRKQ